jgi:hypothetical protein
MSTMVVKFSLPCLTCTTGFLPWLPLRDLEPSPCLFCLGLGQSLM